ncbi:RING-type E3 ubiquitin transferase [Malassezia sp. CBS 17886]|nr:RING-type E3 ubiquitin transferase [Malassezia sp. CBS 17886]
MAGSTTAVRPPQKGDPAPADPLLTLPLFYGAAGGTTEDCDEPHPDGSAAESAASPADGWLLAALALAEKSLVSVHVDAHVYPSRHDGDGAQAGCDAPAAHCPHACHSAAPSSDPTSPPGRLGSHVSPTPSAPRSSPPPSPAHLHLHITVHAAKGALHRGHDAATTDELLALVHRANGRATPAHQAMGAGLVYKSLCDREADADTRMPEAPQPRALHAHLLPFQRRSVAFLLEREAPAAERRILRDACGPWWVRVGASPLFFHVLTGELTDDAARAGDDVAGAVLAEEMGLGKTVEILALILQNRAPERNELPAYWDAANEVHVYPVAATLIVAPETLRGQWLDEIATHAPSLRVYSFLGHRAADADRAARGHVTWGAWARDVDVVVLSFETLARELAASHKAPPRTLRRPARYARPRSPLVQLAFRRVVMDEVQLVGGNAARTMALVPRASSVAVSGTPVRRVEDLRGSLAFLGLLRAAATPSAWQRVLAPTRAPYVADVLRRTGIRHTKVQVAHEMVLPVQTRSLIPVDFSYTETAFYRDVLSDALDALGMDADGTPRSEAWQLDAAVLRAQLLRLRQACTNPRVLLRAAHGGGMRAAAPGAAVNLRSIDHVLVVMIDGTKSELLTLRHSVALKRIYCAAVLLFAPRDELLGAAAQSGRVAENAGGHRTPNDALWLHELASCDRLALARAQLERVLPDAHDHVARLEAEVRDAHVHGPLYEFSAEELRREDVYEERTRGDDTAPPWATVADAPSDKVRARQQHVAALRNRLRHWLQVVHRVHQFMGHCFFQMSGGGEADGGEGDEGGGVGAGALKNEAGGKEGGATERGGQEGKAHDATPGTVPKELRALEDAAYEAAEATRQRLLKDARDGVAHSLAALVRAAETVTARDFAPAPTARVGLAGQSVVERIAACSAALAAHAAVVCDWRTQMRTRLCMPVNREVDRERENDDVYAENLDAQTEAETLLEMYRPLLAQRDELLTGRIALGSTARPQLFVELDRSLRAAKTRHVAAAPAPDEADAAEVQRAQLAHFQRLERERTAVARRADAAPLAELLAQLRDARDAATRAEDIAVLTTAHTQLHAELRRQTQLQERLRREQALFQALFNARALYFKQMQELSDQVQDPEMPGGAIESLRAAHAQERAWRRRIGALEGRVRYLEHLERVQAADAVDEEARRCFICTNAIETGVLTNACGHLCCTACFHAWVSGGHRTCPMCKTRLALRDVHRVVYRRAAPHAGAQPCGSHADHPSPAPPSQPTRLARLDAAERARVERTATHGRFGSKLDLLTKHLVHLHRTSGAKSLVFSAFSRGLDLVAEALHANGLEHARLEGAGGKAVARAVDQFQHTPTVNILLLHSEAQSAGLNLLAATHIFLLEPLLNHALELQAIGRVHRIGQTQPTHVYGYMVNDTVEQRIVALAASRGQSLYTARHTDTDSAALHARILHAAAQQTGGALREACRGDLVEGTDALLACLFQEHTGGGPWGEGGARHANAVL